MLILATSSFILAAGLYAAWYCVFLQQNRRRAKDVMRWVESSLAGRGQVVGISWATRSRFKVPLRLTGGMFHRAWVLIDFTPKHAPALWLISKLRGKREVLTFQADLDLPPALSLHVANFRWFARSSKKPLEDDSGWQFEHTGPFVISTRKTSAKEVASAVMAFSRGNNGEFTDISFQRRSPHFSVTLPLEAIAPESPGRLYILDSMRELASSSSASLFDY